MRSHCRAVNGCWQEVFPHIGLQLGRGGLSKRNFRFPWWEYFPVFQFHPVRIVQMLSNPLPICIMYQNCTNTETQIQRGLQFPECSPPPLSTLHFLDGPKAAKPECGAYFNGKLPKIPLKCINFKVFFRPFHLFFGGFVQLALVGVKFAPIWN